MTRLSDATVTHLRRVADQPDLTGTRYEVIEPLGRGGMGAVYLVRDRELDRLVALKVLVPGALSPEILERLVREAKILARLEHPGIVPVHDVGRTGDDLPFYTMKLVRGQRLDQHVTPETTLAERLHIIERICEAVAFAHARGVIHRDLKPGNIMVGSFGEVLVMDWGVARLQTALAAAATTESGGVSAPRDGITGASGAVIGTPGFMAPEQARGDNVQVNEQSDVYGLGAILGALLAGCAAPRSLLAIAEKATAPEASSRYTQAADLADDIKRFREGLPVSAYRETLVERAGRLLGRYRLPLGLILAYVLMRLLLLVLVGH